MQCQPLVCVFCIKVVTSVSSKAQIQSYFGDVPSTLQDAR